MKYRAPTFSPKGPLAGVASRGGEGCSREHEALFTFYGVRTVHKSATTDHKTVVFAPKVYRSERSMSRRRSSGPRSRGTGPARAKGEEGGGGDAGRVPETRTMGPRTRKTLRHFGATTPGLHEGTLGSLVTCGLKLDETLPGTSSATNPTTLARDRGKEDLSEDRRRLDSEIFQVCLNLRLEMLRTERSVWFFCGCFVYFVSVAIRTINCNTIEKCWCSCGNGTKFSFCLVHLNFSICTRL